MTPAGLGGVEVCGARPVALDERDPGGHLSPGGPGDDDGVDRPAERAGDRLGEAGPAVVAGVRLDGGMGRGGRPAGGGLLGGLVGAEPAEAVGHDDDAGSALDHGQA
ncbi:hypothetical protein BJF81_06470 [Ornithinimicrobium sp. CNJ-824]|uniref:hypothetical protein n=1 Tax=Ornithinimicrobium sp. CNJ-824 TaxID=1904966 RepID=UPI000964936C|nr:hypothetical protein [Ornithinimicrobium sp. CNJ-824]OLT20030.1 hypothetical protein BJF81_06470 [Ornithinimicrobium sp. CNJ-824]